MAVVGLAVGSFLNVVSDRWPLGQSIVSPPSHCPHCKHRLSPLENVPLFTYLWLRGRCCHCAAPIPRRVLLIEAVTGALFAYIAFSRGLSLETGVLLFFLAVMIVIFVIDLEHSLILNRVVYPSALIALALAPLAPPGQEVAVGTAYLSALGGGALGFGILLLFFLMAWLTFARGRLPMGEGDLKMAALMGLMLGYSLLFIALWSGFLLGGVVAAVLLMSRLRQWHAQIPFGPFLATGTVIALLWGDPIVDWYQGLFGG